MMPSPSLFLNFAPEPITNLTLQKATSNIDTLFLAINTESDTEYSDELLLSLTLHM